MKLVSFLTFSLSLLLVTQSFAQKGRAAERRTGNFEKQSSGEETTEVSDFDRFSTACEVYNRSAARKDELRMEHRERGLLKMMQEEVGLSNSQENAALEAGGNSSNEERSESQKEETEQANQSDRLAEQRALLTEFEGLYKKYDRASVHRKREILETFSKTMEQMDKANQQGLKEDNSEVREER